MVRQNDAIILKKTRGGKSSEKYFIHLKIQLIKNDAIENFHHFKIFFLELAPFDLNLDGNFCDESYKYAFDILQNTKKIVNYSNYIFIALTT